MALQLQTVERRFTYNGRVLPDPDPGLSPDAVRQFYAGIHADLLNATIEGGDFDGQTQVFEFRRAVGNKGA